MAVDALLAPAIYAGLSHQGVTREDVAFAGHMRLEISVICVLQAGLIWTAMDVDVSTRNFL